MWHTSTDKTTCSTLSTQRGGFNPIRPGPTEGTDPIMTKILDCIVSLIDCGVPVFPCRENKRPACPHGFLDASTDRATVSDLFGLPGAALIGVPCGVRSGLDALDVDPKHDGHLWWQEEAYRIPATRTHRSQSGGLHVLFRADPAVRNTQGLLGTGVDTRGEGGFIVWWAAHGCRVGNPHTLLSWPEWLLDGLRPKARPVPTPPTRYLDRPGQPAPGAALRVFERALAKLEQATDGQRHLALRKAAYATGGVLHHLGMTRAQAVTELVTAVMHSGARDQNNATKTAIWAIQRGEQSPFTMGGRS